MFVLDSKEHERKSAHPQDNSCRGLPVSPLPPEDLALFSGLQPHEVRAVAESRIQAYRAMIESINGYIVHLSTIQNTTVPLHATLPPEILMNIFRHSFPSRRSDIRLTHVCKLWRDLIHRTPEFWVDMLASNEMTTRHLYFKNEFESILISSFITRSSPLPYELRIHQGELAFLTKIASHASRIHSLSLHLPLGSDGVARLTTLFDLDMPLMETMQCWSYTEIWSSGTDSRVHRLPHEAKFPRLRKLALHGPGLATQAFAFPSVQELKIDDGVFSDPLLDLLEGCPQLEVLEMNIQAPEVRPVSLERDAVPLPHLKTFSLLLDAPGGLWMYKLLAHGDIHPSGALSDLAGLFSNAASLTAVTLRLDSGITASKDVWTVIFDAIPSLSSLTVHIDSCRDLLVVLRKNPARWPALRRLSISCHNGSGIHESLLAVVENRAREGLRLKYLAFSGSREKPLSEHRMRRLQGWVDEVTTVDDLEL
ncbi:hypothetical protein C8T65DRAFT_832453 [Cerioporus squamosus]|nr:hypothetical protein C8T65DRAFT_832453 [Cerioporus squamosus]